MATDLTDMLDKYAEKKNQAEHSALMAIQWMFVTVLCAFNIWYATFTLMKCWNWIIPKLFSHAPTFTWIQMFALGTVWSLSKRKVPDFQKKKANEPERLRSTITSQSSFLVVLSIDLVLCYILRNYI